MIKAECEWLLEPAIVVAAADDCFNKPTRLQQIVAETSHRGGCNR